MTTTSDPRDHFAHCIQIFGGLAAASRRLGIDERAIRRFINGELPISRRLLEDTAAALRVLVNDATSADAHLVELAGAWPTN